MVTICTASLTFNNSTFCPHSVFMCFLWISEQTAIISLYNINWLVCITKAETVYCAVWTGSLNQTDTVSSIKSWLALYGQNSTMRQEIFDVKFLACIFFCDFVFFFHFLTMKSYLQIKWKSHFSRFICNTTRKNSVRIEIKFSARIAAKQISQNH